MQDNNSNDFTWLSHYPQAIDWKAEIAPQPLTMLLKEAVQNYATHTALDFMGRKFTYFEIEKEVRHLAAALQIMGVEKGSRVGLFLPNCPQFIISYYAILLAGGVVVNFNPLYSPREVEFQIKDAGVKIMITLNLKALYPKLSPLIEKGLLRTIIVSDMQECLPMIKGFAFSLLRHGDMVAIPDDAHHADFHALIAHEKEPFPVEIDPVNDVAVLQYTGGTTGVPKGTILTHANVYCNAVQVGHWFTGMEAGKERVMGVLPLFHVFAMTTVMNLAIHKGLEVILHPKFEMKKVLEDITHKKPTMMPGVPTMFTAINNNKSLSKYDLSSIKMCISGGAPLPREVKEKFEATTGCKLIEGYGLSETSPVASANPLFGTNKTGSIGLPLPQTIMEVVHMDDKVTLMPQGEIGEICIRGPQVMQGYWHKPEETDLVLKGGRLHTGDLGYMDEEGYFFIVDRLKEMIISGGYNIYPRNVEEAIYLHPGVAEAAVIGIAHESRGQVPKAFVVKKEGVDFDDIALKTFLKSQLAAFEVPHAIEFRSELPKTLIGKIDKKQLKENV